MVAPGGGGGCEADRRRQLGGAGAGAAAGQRKMCCCRAQALSAREPGCRAPEALNAERFVACAVLCPWRLLQRLRSDRRPARAERSLAWRELMHKLQPGCEVRAAPHPNSASRAAAARLRISHDPRSHADHSQLHAGAFRCGKPCENPGAGAGRPPGPAATCRRNCIASTHAINAAAPGCRRRVPAGHGPRRGKWSARRRLVSTRFCRPKESDPGA